MKPEQPPQKKSTEILTKKVQNPEAIIENDLYFIEQHHKMVVETMFKKSVTAKPYIGEFPGLVDKNTPIRNLEDLRKHYGKKWEKLQSTLMEYLNQPGGKRLRPLLLINSFRTFSESKELSQKTEAKALVAAVGIELLHETTLLVDDVLDDSKLRRGQLSLWARIEASGIEKEEAKKITLDLAPLVFSWARDSILNHIGGEFRPDLEMIFWKTIEDLKTGEIYDLRQAKLKEWPKFDIKTDIANLHRKSGEYSIEFPLYAGFIFSGAPKKKNAKDVLKAVSDFSYLFGLAFQLHDDLLIMKTSSEIGKDSNTDAVNNNKIFLVHFTRILGSFGEMLKDGLTGSKTHGEIHTFFDKVWGNAQELTPANIGRIKTLFKETGAQKLIVSLIKNLQKMTKESLDKIEKIIPGYDISILRYILKEGLTWMDDLDASVGLK